MTDRRRPVDVVTGELIPTLGENLRAHPREQFCHALTGAVAFTVAVAGGHFVGPELVAGVALSGLVCVRQCAEFARRRDNVGYDMLWHIVGATLGILGSVTAIVIAIT